MNIDTSLKHVPRKQTLNLALQLGVSIGKVTTLEEDHPKDANRVFIEMLQSWVNNVVDPEPSWEVLENALAAIEL